jgi:hypothetical protein
MFQKFEMICLMRFVACAAIAFALPRSHLLDGVLRIAKNRKFSKLKKKSDLSGGTANEDTRRSRLRGEEAA